MLKQQAVWKSRYVSATAKQWRYRHLRALRQGRRSPMIGKLQPRHTTFVERQLISRHFTIQQLLSIITKPSSTIASILSVRIVDVGIPMADERKGLVVHLVALSGKPRYSDE